MTFYTAISVFATVGFNQVLTATKTVGLHIFEKILLSFPFLPLLNSVYWVCMTRFCWWRSAGGFCVKLPLCPTELVPDGSKTESLLAEAKLLRDGGTAPGIWVVGGGKSAQQPVAGEWGEKGRNSSADTQKIFQWKMRSRRCSRPLRFPCRPWRIPQPDI